MTDKEKMLALLQLGFEPREIKKRIRVSSSKITYWSKKLKLQFSRGRRKQDRPSNRVMTILKYRRIHSGPATAKRFQMTRAGVGYVVKRYGNGENFKDFRAHNGRHLRRKRVKS